MYFKIILGI